MHSETGYALVLVTLTLLAACCAQPTRSRYCGSYLADALKLACGASGYNPPAWAEELYGITPSKGKYIKSLGVATECCYNGCSWGTITSYCAEPQEFGHKSKKSIGDTAVAFGDLSGVDEISGADLMAAAPEMEIENIQRSAPLFGTVSPEYLRLPRTLDEVPPPYPGLLGY